MRRLVPLALVLALAGCGGGPTISASGLGNRILRARDVGSGFSSFYDNRQTALDTQGTPRADQSRFDRKGGWVARFKRSGAANRPGPLLVESRIDVFAGSSGAKKDLDLYRGMYASAPGQGVHALALPELGDEAVGQTFVQAGARPLRFFRVAWRYRNATAQVLAEGFDGKLREADAVRLARAQQRRLAGSS
jgi:hypothetical protein